MLYWGHFTWASMSLETMVLDLASLVYEGLGGAITALRAIDHSAPWCSVAAYVGQGPVAAECDGAEIAMRSCGRQSGEGVFANNSPRVRPGVDHRVDLEIAFGPEAFACLSGIRCRQRPFSDREKQLLLALAPHVERALRIHRSVGADLASAALLDTLPLGVAFIGHDLRPRWWNRYADRIFRAQDGLELGASGFRTASPVDRLKLEALIRKTCRGGAHRPTESGALAVTRPSLRRGYAVLVVPVHSASATENQAVAGVLITDPELDPTTTAPWLGCQFNLTPSEARLALAMLQGKTVEQAAIELQLRIATVRTHVRNLLHKTRTTRQAELVRVLLSGPALLSME